MIRIIWHIFLRDCRLQLLSGNILVLQLGFLLIVASLFAFGVGADNAVLADISVALVWVALLLSSLFSLSNLFEADLEDGSLLLLSMQSLPLELLVLTKYLAHWCVHLLPILIATPLLAEMFSMPREQLTSMTILLPIVTALMTLIGGLGASLTLGAQRSTGLLGILIFPFYIPALIFSVSAVSGADELIKADALTLVTALLVLVLPLSVILSAATLKQALRQ